MILILLATIVALVFAGFYAWAKRQGLVTAAAPAEAEPAGRVSRLTEAVAYVGAVLILAGGATAVGQRWDDIPFWLQVGVFAGAAVLFLAVGLVVRRTRDPAFQRLVDVTWLLSVVATGGAVAVAAQDLSGEQTVLLIGLATSAYAAGLWLFRTRASELVALFAGLVVTVSAAVANLTTGRDTWLVAGLVLWAFGLGFAALGWRRYVEPMWLSTALGVVLALVAPAVAVPDHGWVHAVGIGTAAAAMALSVRLRHTPLLATGTVAMFGYVTSLVVRYFGDSLGVPAALAITGALILVLAAVAARLVRLTRPSKPEPPATLPPPRRHLPKAS